MIPDIKMKAPCPCVTEYASSSRATEPSYFREIIEDEMIVTLEYAGFLIDNGHIDQDDYEYELAECDFFLNMFDELEADHGEKIAMDVIHTIIRNDVNSAVEDNKSFLWEDWA